MLSSGHQGGKGRLRGPAQAGALWAIASLFKERVEDAALLERFDAALADAPATFPDDAVALWPAARYALWRYLRRAARGRLRCQSMNPFPCDAMASTRMEGLAALSAADILVAAPPRPSIERFDLDGGAIDPSVDPVIGALTNDWRLSKVAMDGRGGAAAPTAGTMLRPPSPVMPGRQERRAAAAAAHAARALRLWICPDVLAAHLAAYRTLVDAWRFALDRVAPRLVLFAALGQHMALADAARRQGLPAAELQHGVIRRISALHRGWGPALHDGAWPGLPSHVWCWSSADAAYVDSAFGGQVQAAPLGRPAPDAIRIRPASTPPRRIVVTLQDQARLPAPLAEAIHAQPGLDWIVVPHPRWDRFDRRAAPGGLRIAEPEESLADLLASADAHVTRDSAAVYEAATLGAPTWVCGATGRRAFAEEIAEGAVRELRTPRDLLDHSAGDGVTAVAEPFSFDPARALEMTLTSTSDRELTHA